ncbi:MAG: CopD family protein [Anaerolineales bacterium]|nr:CopD family protein [Anaerolineales bacterium]
MPFWVLSLIFWLHMLATVTWIGSLAATSFLILPAAKKTLKPADQLAFLSALQRRLEPIAWFCLALLLVTGMFQLSVNPHYDGFLSTSSQWSLAILGKHLLVMGMVIVSAVQTWEILPAIRQTLLRLEKGQGDEEGFESLRKKETRLLRLNFILGVLILAATALARAS